MRWKKKGQIFRPSGESGWMHSFAQVPRVVIMDDRLRIYFATRSPKDADGQFVSRIGFVEVDRRDPGRLLRVSGSPSLDLGGVGEFDRFGVMPGWPGRVGEELRMYYTGWSRRTDVPYVTAIGLAKSADGGETFRRAHPGPVMAATPRESLLCNGPFLVEDGPAYRMYYASAVSWLPSDAGHECHYVIKQARSEDGVHWQRDGCESVPQAYELECQNAPTVLRIGDSYHMWFCHRHALDFRNAERGYRIGYAWSRDLERWNRDDSLAGIVLSDKGWDSEMICYPSTYIVDDRVLMFYCGNGFGAEGFGYAELDGAT